MQNYKIHLLIISGMESAPPPTLPLIGSSGPMVLPATEYLSGKISSQYTPTTLDILGKTMETRAHVREKHDFHCQSNGGVKDNDDDDEETRKFAIG